MEQGYSKTYNASEAAKKRVSSDLKEQILTEEEENPHPTATRRLEEKALLWYIESGDVERVREYTGKRMSADHTVPPFSGSNEGVQVGVLSRDALKQAILLSVSGITLFTRAAVDGGVPEHIAFSTSDAFIREISKQTDIGVIRSLMGSCIVTFTDDVFHYKHKNCSRITMDCCQYIQRHLHDRITMSMLSDVMHRSPNYISDLFAKELGIRPAAYIRREKLCYAAKLLELTDLSIFRIAELLAFPSSSAFATYFKAQYHVTPLAYRNKKAVESEEDRTEDAGESKEDKALLS